MFAGTQMAEEDKPKKVTLKERTQKAYRQGHHATVYDVRKDPKLTNNNIIRDKKALMMFPFVSGKSYKGQWSGDLREGFGTEINPDGTKYEGEWSNNKRNGKGTVFMKQGKRELRTYVGEWVNDCKEGYGVFYYPNGVIYRGEWKQNKRCGKGRIDLENGDYYDGDWLEDKKSGFGSYFCSNGNSYEGLWMDDLKEGPGRFFYASTGKVYEGEWAEDQPRCGEYREPSGDELEKFGDPSVRKQSYNLPEMGLASPNEVLEMAVTSTRMENSDRRGLGSNNGTITQEQLDHLKAVFHSLDGAKKGTVAVGALGPFFGAAGLSDTIDEGMIQLFQELEVDLDAGINFPEAIDVLQYMLTVY